MDTLATLGLFFLLDVILLPYACPTTLANITFLAPEGI